MNKHTKRSLRRVALASASHLSDSAIERDPAVAMSIMMAAMRATIAASATACTTPRGERSAPDE